MKYLFSLALACCAVLSACGGDGSSSPSDPSNPNRVPGSSDSGKASSSVCDFKKSDNVWKFSYSTWNYIEEYTWVGESTVEFKEYMNSYHMDEDDTTYTDVERDEFFDRIMEHCLSMNDLLDESSSSGGVSDDEFVESSSAEVTVSSSNSEIALSSSNESAVLSSSSEIGNIVFISPMSSSSEIRHSSSSVAVAKPCKTEIEDLCEYDSLNDERDGQVYKTVKIGNQWWMAENLNYSDSALGIVGYSLCENSLVDSCKIYGRYYSWMIAVDTLAVFSTNAKECGHNITCDIKLPARGICPEGWHLPSDAEWAELYAAMGKSKNAMLAKGFEEFPDATDSYGFSALPSGGYFVNDFSSVGTKVIFWTSTEYSISRALYWILTKEICGLNDDYVKYEGFPVRCIKD